MSQLEKIRVLIVDDSVFMRQAITKLLSEPDIEIIDTAKNGAEGVEKAKALKPDVITMDIEMPIMNGLQAVAEIMKVYPVPILMVSTLTSEGADATIEALSNGAVDFITKKAAFREMDSLKAELVGKIRSLYKNSALSNMLNRKKLLKSMDNSRPDTIRPKSVDSVFTGVRDYTAFINPGRKPLAGEVKLICIGISTGGPSALQEVCKSLPGNLPVPIMIVQHMPPLFTKSLAKRLDSISDLSIKEAVHGDFLEPGKVYLAPGGSHMTVSKSRRIAISDEPSNTLFKPCVDVMLSSALDNIGRSVVGVIMTGMGNNGAKELKRLSDMGGYVISQDIESCVVAGMTKAVIDQKIANEIVPLSAISESIASIFGLHSKDYTS